MTDFTIIMRSLRVRLFSTVITIFTVGIAVALLLVLLSMKDAGRQAFSRGSGNAHLIVSGDSDPLAAVLNALFYANPPARPIDWNTYNRITSTYPLEFAVPTQQGDSFQNLPVVATTPEFFTVFRPDVDEPWALRDGRFLDQSDPFQVVLGSNAAKSTGLRLNDQIHLTHGIAQSRQGAWLSGGGGTAPGAEPHIHREFSYTVVGILNPTGSAHDRALFTTLDSTWIIHAHDRRIRETPGIATTLADITDDDRKITGIYLRCATRPGQDASAAIPVIASRLRADSAFTVAQPTSQVERLFALVSNINQIFVAIAGAVMISSGIGIMLALYNSMDQRRRQIAVLRVLGASAGRIFSLVLTESALLGILGAVLGVAISFAGAAAVAAILKAQLGIVIAPHIGADWTLSIVAVTALIAIVAGVIPAAMAYRTPVVQNLRPIG